MAKFSTEKSFSILINIVILKFFNLIWMVQGRRNVLQEIEVNKSIKLSWTKVNTGPSFKQYVTLFWHFSDPPPLCDILLF